MYNIKEILDVVTDSDLLEMVRVCNGAWGLLDEWLYYHMDEFDSTLEVYTPSEVANMVHFGRYNPSDDLFQFDGYGNISTISEYQLLRDLVDDAEHIVETWLTLDYRDRADTDLSFDIEEAPYLEKEFDVEDFASLLDTENLTIMALEIIDLCDSPTYILDDINKFKSEIIETWLTIADQSTKDVIIELKEDCTY